MLRSGIDEGNGVHRLFTVRALVVAVIATAVAVAEPTVERVEPPFWWAGMEHPGLELMVQGESVSYFEAELECAGVRLVETHRVDSPNYLFLELGLGPDLVPGTCEIRLRNPDGGEANIVYRFDARRPGSAQRTGFSSADVLYLVMPDRFANGDPSNDSVPGMLEEADRANPDGRHGGDLQGIIDHLDYIADMGYTQVWLNPVLENNEPEFSYHGYSTTDYYQVDPRLGDNDLYRELSAQARQRGIGIIMDLIPNHSGVSHWWMDDLPSRDWINHGRFVPTNHIREPLHDPHAAEIDRATFVDGWFVPSMPDLNQRNPFLATYLIQNAIWWVEYADLSGIRVDTWSYADKHFLSDWTRRVMTEYPNFNVVGEEWNNNPGIIAYWQRGKERNDGYESDLVSLMDFPLQIALRESLDADETWNTGIVVFYRALVSDFLYADPANLLVFADNHDMHRIYRQLDGDADLFRMAMAMVLTTRGIPQLLYGTEVLIDHPPDASHGVMRVDFPGGWAGDPVDGFSGEGLSPEVADTQRFLKRLLNWRKTSDAVRHGRLTHYAPADGIYVTFRHTDSDRVMVLVNKNADAREVPVDRFAESLYGANLGVDVLTGGLVGLDPAITVPGRGFLILELR
ncbi:MAG: glycoside hydrolase family 13 protein [Pseudomonadales bacterium]|nr:glycoside hydrolase family 13 protein [Pseudomonadales bacterium]